MNSARFFRLCAVPVLWLGAGLGLRAADTPAEPKLKPKSSLGCAWPYRAEIGRPFVVAVALEAPDESSSTMVPVTMGGHGDDVTYEPAAFTLSPGKKQFVNVTVKSSRSGLVVMNAFPGDDRGFCDFVIDVGFQGHLKATALPLVYNEPQSLNVQIVDSNDKPIPADTSLKMSLQSADAVLNAATLDVPIGSTESLPFLMRSMNLKGGPVHLLATLTTKDRVVLSQNVFALDTEPVWWLPVLLAIGGGLLHGIYRALQEPRSRGLIVKLAISIVAGLVAYLFANLDLLGLKLDPHLLRTYPLIGFLFSFIGIDVLLPGKFTNKKTGEAEP